MYATPCREPMTNCRGSWVVGRGSWVVGRGWKSWVVGVGVGKSRGYKKKLIKIKQIIKIDNFADNCIHPSSIACSSPSPPRPGLFSRPAPAPLPSQSVYLALPSPFSANSV